MTDVLLTDGQLRKTLAAARSLGEKGLSVAVSDVTRCSLTRFSRYCTRGLLSPPPEHEAAYGAWLCGASEAARVLLPMDDLSTRAALAHVSQLKARTLLPPKDTFELFADKLETAYLAKERGVPAPRSLPVEDEGDLMRAQALLGGRAVLRPRRSSGGRGVRFLDGADRWPAPGDLSGCLVQERVDVREKFDVCLLFAADGSLRAHFIQQELRWFPEPHGASVVQRSVVRPDLLQLALRLLEGTDVAGPLEVEFAVGPQGPVLMEVNGRFWNSLALAIRCGVDFPALTVSLALGEDVDGPKTYRQDVFCRWSLPGDLLHLAVRPLDHLKPPVRPKGALCFDDIVSAKDPGPLLGFCLAVARYIWSPSAWRFLFRW